MYRRFHFVSLFLSFLAAFPLATHAQRHEILDPQIRSLQVVAGQDWLNMPVITLQGNRSVNISFDDLTHEYHRYNYRIEHCEADWSTSHQLFESDFVYGFADQLPINDVQESINTNVLYTHYRFSIPNERCSLKLSGNYRVTVYDDNDDERPVLKACFMVLEPQMGVQMDVTTNTDVDINRSHQQVSMQVTYGNLSVVDPMSQLKTVVLQNARWDDARFNARPQFNMPNSLRWDHCRDYVFEAGNEYHKFETLDVDHPTMGVDRIRWDGQQYHAYVFPDLPRPNYLYDEDANGAFYIRNSDNVENDRTCDYLQTHFTLQSPYVTEGDVFLNGCWTNDRFLPEYQMEFDEETQTYNAVVELKQGYYSYQYLILRPDGTTAPVPSQGNFYQTQNTYQALIYYKEQGGRADRLVGYQHITTR